MVNAGGAVASVHAIYGSQDIQGDELESLVSSLKWFSVPQRLVYQVVGPAATEAFHAAVGLHSIDGFLGTNLYALIAYLVVLPCAFLLLLLAASTIAPALYFGKKRTLTKKAVA